MKKSTVLSLTSLAVIAIVLIGMASCNKKFDAPPVYIKPNITANTTIMGLKTQYGSLGASADSLITGDVIITGTVTADDQSGNFFKNIVIQDSTGAISIQLSATNLYTTYNIGRQIWIKCKGLYIGNYNNTLTIGAGPGTTSSGKPTMEGIPSTMVSQYVIQGEMLNNIKPTVVTAAQLTTNPLDPLQNVLVELDNYEFAAADTNRTYADPTLVSTTAGTFYPQTCSGTNKTLELYNSNYAYFAGLPVPKGHGSLIGIYAVYGTYKEIEIRDTSDVQFYSTTRCSGGGGGGGTTPTMTIAQLRALYTGTTITALPAGTVITGVVISDATNKNLGAGNVVIQQGSNGINLYFGSTAPSVNLGDSVTVDLSGAKLQSYKGSLEADPKSSSNLTKVGTGTIVPVTMTIAQLNTALANPLGSAANNEYTLVKILNVSAPTPAGPYYTLGVYPNLNDGTASIELYTNKNAVFGAQTMPTSTMTWTGYANMFNTTSEIMIRNPTLDVQ